MDRQLIDKIEKNLKGNLPGYKAHEEMAVKGHYRRRNAPTYAQKAGVLALFIPAGLHWELVFIKRSDRYQSDRHRGQIGFPGGKTEDCDNDICETALRETHEEIGVSPHRINLIGQLTPLYIPVSNFRVFPSVGFLEQRPVFKLQEEEVDDVILWKFNHFLNRENRKKTSIKLTEGIQMKNVPYFDLDGKILWGATAMMLSELIRVAEKK